MNSDDLDIVTFIIKYPSMFNNLTSDDLGVTFIIINTDYIESHFRELEDERKIVIADALEPDCLC